MAKQAPREAKSPRRPYPLAGESVQYTVREVPAQVDRVLRRRAQSEGKSLNRFLRDTLAKEAGEGRDPLVTHHDLDALIGTWEDDPEFDAVIAEQHRIDETLWR